MAIAAPGRAPRPQRVSVVRLSATPIGGLLSRQTKVFQSVAMWRYGRAGASTKASSWPVVVSRWLAGAHAPAVAMLGILHAYDSESRPEKLQVASCELRAASGESQAAGMEEDCGGEGIR